MVLEVKNEGTAVDQRWLDHWMQQHVYVDWQRMYEMIWCILFVWRQKPYKTNVMRSGSSFCLSVLILCVFEHIQRAVLHSSKATRLLMWLSTGTGRFGEALSAEMLHILYVHSPELTLNVFTSLLLWKTAASLVWRHTKKNIFQILNMFCCRSHHKTTCQKNTRKILTRRCSAIWNEANVLMLMHSVSKNICIYVRTASLQV